MSQHSSTVAALARDAQIAASAKRIQEFASLLRISFALILRENDSPAIALSVCALLSSDVIFSIGKTKQCREEELSSLFSSLLQDFLNDK